MKKILVLIAIAYTFYYGYGHFRKPQEPKLEEFKNPSYVEMRMKMEDAGRTMDLVLFAKMASESECKEQSDKIWKDLVQNCRECTMNLVACKENLISRYEMLFDNTPTNVTYISLARGAPQERDGRIVFWGVTATESGQLCELVKPIFQKPRVGAVTCVPHISKS